MMAKISNVITFLKILAIVFVVLVGIAGIIIRSKVHTYTYYSNCASVLLVCVHDCM